MHALELTELLLCVVVARPMLSEFVVRVHPVTVVVHVLKAHDAVVEIPCAVAEHRLRPHRQPGQQG
jgi:hypothetical protein